MTITHHTNRGEAEVAWPVDPAACATVARWAARRPEVLRDDLAGMAEFFPHWLLAGAMDGRTARCAACQELLAPRDGALRCLGCGQAGDADGLIWIGQLPALVRPEPRFATRRTALRAAGFAEVAAGGHDYLLAPLAVLYPHEWPSVEPEVRYAPRWLDALGLPRASAAHHLIGVGRACLYVYGQWQAAPIHAVLQQRVVNHLASLLKIAAGQSPQRAFIGRIHHDDWRPEAGDAA